MYLGRRDFLEEWSSCSSCAFLTSSRIRRASYGEVGPGEGEIESDFAPGAARSARDGSFGFSVSLRILDLGNTFYSNGMLW